MVIIPDAAVAVNMYETSATVEDQGRVRVAGVPFAPGTQVEVTISPKDEAGPCTSAELSRRPAYEELAKVANTCRTPDWDAHGAQPVSAATVQHARRLIEALPPVYPSPSVGAEPDGHVTLEWYRATNCLLSVSVSPEGMLYYAALLGEEDPRGSCPFAGVVPETILYCIRRVCAHDRPQ
jgi:hypothetical protein